MTRTFRKKSKGSEHLDDEAAYMALATSNNQGELSPLEIGIHALHYIEPEEGGRGKKGGVRDYARQVGKDERYLRQLRDAAQVAETAELTPQFSDKAQHLAAAHKLPQSLWPVACEGQRSGIGFVGGG
jgi:predicted outer membrane protein